MSSDAVNNPDFQGGQVEVAAINVPDIKAKPDSGQQLRQFDFVRNIPVTITAELGQIMMNIEDVLALGPGSLIHLQREIDEPIDLLVNDKLVAKGEIVSIENNFGIRITHIVDSRFRRETATSENIGLTAR